MRFLELVQKRQSTRRFTYRPIPREEILRCLEAARLAPSACNGQPWKFVVVDEPGQAKRLAEEIFSGIYSMNAFAREASALVAVVSEKTRLMSALGGQVRDTKYHLVDLGIACEHLVLQAEELGLASCWIGWFDEKRLKKRLDIPWDKKVYIVLALGYAADGAARPKARKTLDEISAFNSYQNKTKE